MTEHSSPPQQLPNSWRTLDWIELRPFLFAIEEMTRCIQRGDPNSCERQGDFLEYIVPIEVLASNILFTLVAIQRKRHEQRVPAQVESQLSSIEMD